MNLFKKKPAPGNDFSHLEVFNPEMHPMMREIVDYATQKLTEQFSGKDLPKVNFELIPLGTGRGLGARTKAIIDNQPAPEGSMGDVDMGIIIHQPWPEKLTKGYFLGEATRYCEEKAIQEFGRTFCDQFNLFNCNTFTSGPELYTAVYLAFSDIENDPADIELLLPEKQFYQLFSLCLPLLSQDLKVRISYLGSLAQILNDPKIKPLFTKKVQNIWSQIFRKMILPPVKHFYNDPAFQKKFVEQLGLDYL